MTLTLVLVAGWQFPTFPHLMPFLPPSRKVEKKVMTNQKLIFIEKILVDILNIGLKNYTLKKFEAAHSWLHCDMPSFL